MSILAAGVGRFDCDEESEILSDVKQGPGAFLNKPVQEALQLGSVSAFSSALDLQLHRFNRPSREARVLSFVCCGLGNDVFLSLAIRGY